MDDDGDGVESGLILVREQRADQSSYSGNVWIIPGIMWEDQEAGSGRKSELLETN